MASTVNGLAMLTGRVKLPTRGAWVADVDLDTDQLLPTAARGVTILLLGYALVGTVARQGFYAGRLQARLVAGGNRLATPLPAKGYRAAPASLVVGDILREAGELLSSSSASLAAMLRHWPRSAGPAGRALGAILEALGYSWRVLTDGKLWVGVDAWPASDAVGDVLYAHGHGARSVSPADGSPLLLPGTTFGGERVASVTYDIKAKATRAWAWAA